MPVISPRQLYKIDAIKVKPQGGTAEVPIFVLMKESHATLLELTPVSPYDPELQGTFPAGHPAAGKKYIKRKGGFRYKSWTLIADTQFTVTERVKDASGNVVSRQSKFKELTIGFPVGASTYEILQWIKVKAVFSQLNAIRTPYGRRIGLKGV